MLMVTQQRPNEQAVFIFAHLITQEGEKERPPSWLVYAEKELIGNMLGSSQKPQEGCRARHGKWESGQGEPVCEGHMAGAIWSAHCHWCCPLHSMALDIYTTITMTTTSHVYVLSKVPIGSIQLAQPRFHIHMVAAGGWRKTLCGNFWLCSKRWGPVSHQDAYSGRFIPK